MSEIDPDLEVLVVEPPADAEAVRAGTSEGNDLGMPLHVYGPRVHIDRAPIGARTRPAAMPEALGGLSETERFGLDAFALRRSAEFRETKLRRPRDGEAWDMRGCRPPPEYGPETIVFEGEAPGTGAEAIGPTTIATLDGSVAVGIIIVNGPDAATQFSAAQRTEVVAEVQAGLTWLGNQDPSAGISWHYEIRNVSITTATNATAASDEERWRNPAMAALGHTQNWQGVIDYVRALRGRLNTRWAYCVFFVRGYPLWHFAYASSPRIVMDYANDGWGPTNIDRVFAHETGHIFSAPDEYASSGCTCTSTHGIYAEPNANCANCAPGGGINCLMKANDWDMCAHTRRHFGWGLTSARLPIGAPVHAVSRSRNKLDIFFCDRDGRVMSAAWEPGMRTWWQGFWHLNGGFGAPGAPVTAVSRAPDHLDIFVTGTDGHVYTAAWTPTSGGWRGWWRIGDVRCPPRTPVHVVSRSRDKLDIFVTDTSGRVMSAAWEPGFTDGWHGWWHINGGRGQPGAPVTAVSRAPDHLDIFVVGTDGHAYTAAWHPGSGGWMGWWRIGAIRFPGHAPLTAISRSRNKLDIFGTANGGETMTAAWEPGFTDGWHGWWHIRGGRAQPGTPIHPVSRSADKLDIFVTGTDGTTYTAAWEPAFTDGWHGWWNLRGGRTALGGAVTGVSRSPDFLDAWVVGLDGRVFTAAWEPGFTDGWRGWWPMGV
ncbi:hypothetical protein [Croceibacterium ferulae]|uniref:hypothetical protein n=1 Tax=Croceibacterium ferulae TaxID=1854641 RepID=UPI000EAC3D0C|nr:hypothetical protein [Croceibacterium ferulae]